MKFEVTPLVELKHFEKDFEGIKIFGKVEAYCPSGSIKDRTVFNMLNSYKEDGKLVEGGTIVEATSGNTGISLAYFSKVFNYKAIIIMPTTASVQRREIIESYGATVLQVKGGMVECNQKATEILKTTPNSFIFGQFANKHNPEAHYKMTGPEVYSQLSNIDYIFAGIGTGGTISGIGKYFKGVSPKTIIIGVEPFESPLITKGICGPHVIQGIGANFIPDTFLREYLDEVVTVKGEEAIETAKAIRKEEQLDVGVSSGASLLAAIEYIKNHKLENKNIVVIFPDKGDRYSW